MGPEREISSRSVDDLSEQLRESSRSTSDLGAGVQILTHAVQSLKSSVDDSVRGPGERYVRVAHLEEMFAERGGFVSTVSQEIEKLLYSNWRTACFTDNYHNFSMWDSYGDNHKGACLIFESAQIAGSRQYRGVSGLYKVVYGAKLNEVDFFRSIGVATVGQLKELWYTDAEGNFSECGDHIPRDGERDNDDTVLWSKNYWDKFHREITSKTKYWEHEREWRLVLEDRWLDEGEDSKLIYDFNSLKGIIFGIRSSDEEILKAIKIIQKKCKKHERTDFKFYKAEYSQKTGEIRKNEILLPKALQNVR